LLLNATTELSGVLIEIILIMIVIQGVVSHRDYRAKKKIKKWTSMYLRELLFDYISENESAKKISITRRIESAIENVTPFLSYTEQSTAMLFLHCVSDFHSEKERISFLKMFEVFLELQKYLGATKTENSAVIERADIHNVQSH